MVDHLMLFLPCSEYYFKSLQDRSQHSSNSYAQQSHMTGGIPRIQGESSVIKKIKGLSNLN